jgi:hypothetical protein
MDRRLGLPTRLALLSGLPPALVLAVLAGDRIWGEGHPPLGAVLASWAIYPTLAGYLSRAFLGSGYPSFSIMLLAFLEYPLVGFGIGSLIARSTGRTVHHARIGIISFLCYVAAQLVAHGMLNLQAVNLHLASRTNPVVSEAAVDRIRRSGDSGALPPLQQKFVDDVERHGYGGATLLDTLTQLGGAKGWQDLLQSGRLGVAGQDARTWRFIIDNVREMLNPPYAAARGGVKSPYLRDRDVSQLLDALAAKLAEHLNTVADSEASLTLLSVMRGRPDLCSRYFEIVPNGVRDRLSQATYDLVGNLAAIKSGLPPDSRYNYQSFLAKDEIIRLGREQAGIAEEWASWARTDAAPCHAH